MMKLKIFCDGGSRGNPGPAAGAFVALAGEDKVIKSASKFLGVATNNVAEYEAVLLAANWLVAGGAKRVTEVSFILDSELLVKQLTGVYKIKNVELSKRATKIKKIEKQLRSVAFSYSHVKRHHNKEADALVNRSLDENI